MRDLRNMDIEDFKGLYSINTKGEVYSHRSNRIMKPLQRKDGYYMIQLCKNGNVHQSLIHRIVAKHFIPNTLNLPLVNHKNGIKTDNNVDNLEWVSYSDNLIHAYENLLNKKPIPVVSFTDDNPEIKIYPSARAAEQDGFECRLIAKCCKGKRKTHKGLKWRYHA